MTVPVKLPCTNLPVIPLLGKMYQMEPLVLHVQVEKYLLDLSLDGRRVKQTEEQGS